MTEVANTIVRSLQTVVGFLASDPPIPVDAKAVSEGLSDKETALLVNFLLSLARLDHTKGQKLKKRKTIPVASSDDDDDDEEEEEEEKERPKKKKKQAPSASKSGTGDSAKSRAKASKKGKADGKGTGKSKRKSGATDKDEGFLKWLENFSTTECVAMYRQAVLNEIIIKRKKDELKKNKKNVVPGDYKEVRKQALKEVFAVPMSTENKQALETKEKRDLALFNAKTNEQFGSFSMFSDEQEHKNMFSAFLAVRGRNLKTAITQMGEKILDAKTKNSQKSNGKEVDVKKQSAKKSALKAQSEVEVKEKTTAVSEKKKQVPPKAAVVAVKPSNSKGKPEAEAGVLAEVCEKKPAEKADAQEKTGAWHKTSSLPENFYRFLKNDEDSIMLQLTANINSAPSLFNIAKDDDDDKNDPVMWKTSVVQIQITLTSGNKKVFTYPNPLTKVFGFEVDKVAGIAPQVSEDGQAIEGIFASKHLHPFVAMFLEDEKIREDDRVGCLCGRLDFSTGFFMLRWQTSGENEGEVKIEEVKKLPFSIYV